MNLRGHDKKALAPTDKKNAKVEKVVGVLMSKDELWCASFILTLIALYAAFLLGYIKTT